MINAIDDKRTQGSVKEQIAALVVAELDARSKGAKSTRNSWPNGKMKKTFDVIKVGCYYCLQYGHISSNC